MKKLIFLGLLFVSCAQNTVEQVDERTIASEGEDNKLNVVQNNDFFETKEGLDLNGEGISLAQNADYEKAKLKFLNALEYENKNITILNNLGLVEKSLNNPNKAVEYFEQVISIDSTYYKAHCNYGLLLFEQKEYDKSLIILNKGIKNCTDYVILSALRNSWKFNKYQEK